MDSRSLLFSALILMTYSAAQAPAYGLSETPGAKEVRAGDVPIDDAGRKGPAGSRTADTSSAQQVASPAAGAAAANQSSLEEKVMAAAALPTPRMTDGHADLSGLWTAGGGGGFAQDKAVTAEGQSVHPISASVDSAVASEAARLAARKADKSLRPKYKPEFVAKTASNFERAVFVDPAFKCQPQGVPRIGPPVEILQHDNAVVFLYPSGDNNNSLSTFRVIPTDNGAHDPNADALPDGDSVGHWEGDTLVVDVANIDPDTWLDGDGSIHDSHLRVIEKLTRKGNTLRYELREEDPSMFAEPFTAKPKVLILGNPTEHTAESYPCQERDQENFKNGARR